jgi:hypothetical protein
MIALAWVGMISCVAAVVLAGWYCIYCGWQYWLHRKPTWAPDAPTYDEAD